MTEGSGSEAGPGDGYGDPPLGAYAATTGLFATAVTVAIALGARSGKELPERIGPADVVLIGVATHKLSRVLTKAKVTSFIRAPFTRYRGRAGHGEVDEEVRAGGARQVVGELLTCPYCVSQWIAAGLVGGLVAAPRPTRVLASVYAAETVADLLQLGYHAAGERA